MTQRLIVTAKNEKGKRLQVGYALSEADAKKLRVPVRGNISQEVITQARQKMAEIWTQLK